VQPQFPDLKLHITATDADPHMLERARRGCFPASSLKDFPEEWTNTVFSRSGGEYRVRDIFRSGIDLLCEDIRQIQPAGPFDLILCRHLAFTYFDDSLQKDILKELVARLRPGGILVIGKQETLPKPSTGELCLAMPHSGIYRLESPST
jgi:chemotaxis protein methyltransferase CheR